MLTLPPLAIYAHMPWCVRKCPYCDFNSHVVPEQIPTERYIECLLGDLEYDLPAVQGREVQSIFLGGGTPSLFAPEAIERLLKGMRSLVKIARDAEITLEANPGTIEHGRFAGYREAGINRVSLGVQSFSDRQLKLLGRVHDSMQAVRAAAEIRGAGFENFNLDLMYGLPTQTLNEALEDVTRAVELAPTHLSHYQLALEPGTFFFHQPPELPDEDRIFEMQVACQEALARFGFDQYEVSAYARADFRCRHNLNYWRFGDYLGLGAGAHGKWTAAEARQIHRTERRRQPREYLASVPAAERLANVSLVPESELPFEFMLNTLRLREGFTCAQFEATTGLAFHAVELNLARARGRGLMEEAHGIWRASDLGRRFLNDLQATFLSEAPAEAGRSKKSA